MKQTFWASFRFLLVSTLLFGGVYTLLVTGVGQLLFPQQANGSLVEKDGKVVGSSLIGQANEPADEQSEYFSGRPQSVSQLNPTSEALRQQVAERTQRQLENNPTQSEVPIDLVTASASGVDPDISVEAAHFQVDRIAEGRKISSQTINAIIEEHAETELFSTRKYVNVLALNLALDALQQ